ncbi:MAG: CHRD domain-containing protein [Verrucomicrobiaceae bacterium]
MKTKLILAALAATALPASSATIFFDLEGKGGSGLLGSNETTTVSPAGTGGEILGGISYDDVTNTVTINVGWGSTQGFTDLTSTISGSHLHGPTTSGGTAAFNENAGVLQSLTRSGSDASGGTITQSFTISEANEAALLDGRFYINIHTSNNGGGEIRGNLVAVPEPGTAALALLAGLPLLRRRR